MADRRYPVSIKLSDLPLDELFFIKEIRCIKTKKIGKWFILDLLNEKCVFVNDETNKWMLSNPKQVDAMKKLVQEQKLGFRHIGSSVIKFVDVMDEMESQEFLLSETQDN